MGGAWHQLRMPSPLTDLLLRSSGANWKTLAPPDHDSSHIMALLLYHEGVGEMIIILCNCMCMWSSLVAN